ncbi:MAG: flagellar biosynthetic protein FliO, partial [Gammaproteobacteria bacterium]|nr:flagellar biosynthetic protein FliO [Gammaproteobacteria bacterium]
IQGGVSLGAREKAVLLSVEGRRLLVGIAPGRVQTLLVLDDEPGQQTDFADQLEAASTVVVRGQPGGEA